MENIKIVRSSVGSNNIHFKRIKKWISNFASEVDLYCTLANETEIWQKYKERALVGLLATGICRNDSSKILSILQEFSVKDKKYKGGERGDLFIQYGKTAGYLFECKYTSKNAIENHFSDKENRLYFKNISNQGQNILLGKISRIGIIKTYML